MWKDYRQDHKQVPQSCEAQRRAGTALCVTFPAGLLPDSCPGADLGLGRCLGALGCGHKPDTRRAGPGCPDERGSAPSERKGCSLMCASHSCQWLCHPIVSSVSVEVDQEAYLEPSPPCHRQPLFEGTPRVSLPVPPPSTLIWSSPSCSYSPALTAFAVRCKEFSF